MAIKKSALNGPSAFSTGARKVSKKNSGGSKTKKSGLECYKGGVSFKSDDSHQMHAKTTVKSSGTKRVNSRHPDAVPKMRYLHMN